MPTWGAGGAPRLRRPPSRPAGSTRASAGRVTAHWYLARVTRVDDTEWWATRAACPEHLSCTPAIVQTVDAERARHGPVTRRRRSEPSRRNGPGCRPRAAHRDRVGHEGAVTLRGAARTTGHRRPSGSAARRVSHRHRAGVVPRDRYGLLVRRNRLGRGQEPATTIAPDNRTRGRRRGQRSRSGSTRRTPAAVSGTSKPCCTTLVHPGPRAPVCTCTTAAATSITQYSATSAPA